MIISRLSTLSFSIQPFPGIYETSVRFKQFRKPPLKDFERRRKFGPCPPVIKNVPDHHFQYNSKFEEFTTFEHQIKSLQSAGFHRPYKPYKPPMDVEKRFFEACSRTLPGGLPNQTDLSGVSLTQDISVKSKLLTELAREMGGHTIPNSLLHRMDTLDKLLHFYSAEIDMKTPYERLEEGTRTGDLPPNVTIQLESRRFDPENGTSILDKVTAFPRSSTFIVTPEARRKYKDVIAKHPPWKYAEKD